MGKKKVAAMLKLQIAAGQASPAPPVGPALGQHGVNIMDFVRAYNEATQSQQGTILGDFRRSTPGLSQPKRLSYELRWGWLADIQSADNSRRPGGPFADVLLVAAKNLER